MSKFVKVLPGHSQRLVTPTVQAMQLYTVDISPVTTVLLTARLGKYPLNRCFSVVVITLAIREPPLKPNSPPAQLLLSGTTRVESSPPALPAPTLPAHQARAASSPLPPP